MTYLNHWNWWVFLTQAWFSSSSTSSACRT